MVDSGDISKPVLVIECGHCGGARAFWFHVSPGKPPDLWFQNFPKNGRVMLARETVLVACEKCQSQLDVIVKEYEKTVML